MVTGGYSRVVGQRIPCKSLKSGQDTHSQILSVLKFETVLALLV